MLFCFSFDLLCGPGHSYLPPMDGSSSHHYSGALKVILGGLSTQFFCSALDIHSEFADWPGWLIIPSSCSHFHVCQWVSVAVDRVHILIGFPIRYW